MGLGYEGAKGDRGPKGERGPPGPIMNSMDEHAGTNTTTIGPKGEPGEKGSQVQN